MRTVTFTMAGILIALAVVIYQVKYETRALDVRAETLQKQIAEERDVIAVLRAEWSHLNRPARLERLARTHLGLRPVKPEQVASYEHAAAEQVSE